MTAEHISRQFISQVTGSRTLGLLAGEVAYTGRRTPFWSQFGAGFILGAVMIVAITAGVVVGVMVRG